MKSSIISSKNRVRHQGTIFPKRIRFEDVEECNLLADSVHHNLQMRLHSVSTQKVHCSIESYRTKLKSL